MNMDDSIYFIIPTAQSIFPRAPRNYGFVVSGLSVEMSTRFTVVTKFIVRPLKNIPVYHQNLPKFQ